MLSKNEKPITVEELKNKLSSVWNPTLSWKLTPKGKGFYSLFFESVEDMQNGWMYGPFYCTLGYFKPFIWAPDFVPSNFVSSHAKVWDRFLDLPDEFWHPRLLLGIAKREGTPIKIYQTILDKKNMDFMLGS